MLLENDMKIVRFKGGLGNQLFQYGVYLSLRKVYKGDVLVDLFFFNHNMSKRPFVLREAFNLNLNDYQADKESISKLSSNNLSLLHRLYYKVFNLKSTHFIDKENGFDASIYNNESMYLDGYWQSYKYINNIKSELIKNLKFEYDFNNPYFKSLREDIIKNDETVSIHVRRGDYLKNSIYVDLIQTNYYKNVLNVIELGRKAIYVFSDDIDLVKQLDIFSNYIFVDSSNFPSHYDMYLMSICKINVIANSTYSYWAAYLNHNSDKQIFCPSEWYSKRLTLINDIYPEDWVVVDV